MNVIMKSKVTKKGYLCICVTHTDFYRNDTIIEINSENDMFYKKEIKPRIYIKIDNIQKMLEKDNIVSLRYKEQITKKLEKAKDILKDNGVIVKETISSIQYRNNTPVIQSQRESCKGFLDFLRL